MTRASLIGLLLFASVPAWAQTGTTQSSGVNVVRTEKDEGGWKLKVDGEDFMVLGMNWDYFPAGTNYTFDFWSQSDEYILKALDEDMRLLKAMGANTIRVYVGIPRRWITYIYEKFGIYTVLNHSMGRYGFLVDGIFQLPTNYASERTRELIRDEILGYAEKYKDTPGLLMWLLGNENNYGLYWSSAETEDIPEEDLADVRAQFLYTLYGEITDGIHNIDKNHPVSIANGDLQFIDLIAKYAPNIDILGSNVYRGRSSGDLFDVVKEKLDIPFVYTEFGSDAYNAKEQREDQFSQAEYVRDLWQEIFEHSHGKGRAENAIGGMTFQWVDGWWKYTLDEELDVHNTNASWGNGAYRFDFVQGENNMNEEWFGICARGENNDDGTYPIFPRAAYYVLKEGYKLDPYAASTTLEDIRRHWSRIDPRDYGSQYEVQSLSEQVRKLQMISTINLTLELETFVTGGDNMDDAERARSRFDHLQSVYIDFGLQPTKNVRADVSFNVLGNVARNPINEIYFEDRGLDQTYLGPDGEEITVGDAERIRLYQASFEWDDDWFNLEGYYRKGHYHWAYEGDFFGIYPEANYEPAVDMFNANAPNGVVFTGKKVFDGLKIAAGPELYWGANPTLIAKYYREVGRFEFSFMHQEDIAQQSSAPTSSVIPLPRTRKTSAYLGMTFGSFKLEVGGLMAGTDRLDRRFTIANRVEGPGYLESGYEVLDDQIEWGDTLGAKLKLTYYAGNVGFYVQGGFRGLVADSGYDQTTTFVNWTLRDTGKGNNGHVLAGGFVGWGPWIFAPNFMVQRPLVGPLPLIEDFFDPNTGNYFPGVTPRNLLNDPFWVRENRETYGIEMLIAFDPTGATWMWAWDNVVREDAPLAGFVDFVYKVLPTSQDAGVGVSDPDEGGFTFAFPGAPPARDLWEVRGRLILNPAKGLHMVMDGYGGIVQTTGDDERLIERGGGTLRLTYGQMDFQALFKVNDWGPYDFQRDFNLTFPLQVGTEISYAAVTPEWFVRSYTRFGVQAQYRILDEFSPRFLFDPGNPDRVGNEWEIRTYVHISL